MTAATFGHPGSVIRLAAIAGVAGTWEVWISGARIGTWQATDAGARVTDLSGDVVASADNVGDGRAIVAGCGAQRGQWSDLMHKVLAGNCEIT